MQRNESKIGDRTPWSTLFHPQASLKHLEASQNDVQRLTWTSRGAPRDAQGPPRAFPRTPQTPQELPEAPHGAPKMTTGTPPGPPSCPPMTPEANKQRLKTS